MDIITVMEGVTFVVTIGMFLTGIPPCMDMYKTGSTKHCPFLMFLLSTVSCLSMLHYGAILGLFTLVLINVVGGLLNAAYSAIYIHVIKDKTESVRYLSLSVAFVAVLYGYLYTVLPDEEARAPLLGATGSAITTVLMVLPGIEIIGNIRNHNSDGMPVIMLVGGIACCISWLIYGLLLNDVNIYLPNIPGLIVCCAKLYIIYLYGEEDLKKTS